MLAQHTCVSRFMLARHTHLSSVMIPKTNAALHLSCHARLYPLLQLEYGLVKAPAAPLPCLPLALPVQHAPLAVVARGAVVRV